MGGSNEWAEYRRLVMTEISNLHSSVDNLSSSMNDQFQNQLALISSLSTQIALLKQKAGIWGMLGASIPITLMILGFIVTELIK